MATKSHGEDSNSPSNSGTKKRGKRGVTKKPSYMAEGEFFCGVCESPNPTGYHYGKITCEGCKGFFKRVVQVSRGSSLKCRNNGQCLQEGRKGLRKCASCRYAKCLQIGMDPELVKVGSILVAWNQKKQDNRKRRESLKRSHCDSSEEASMCIDSSNEESFNSGRSLNSSGLGVEHSTPLSGQKSARSESCAEPVPFHADPGVNAFLHFTGFSSCNNIPSEVRSSQSLQVPVNEDRCAPVEEIVKNFKNIIGPREKSRCRCDSAKDAEEMLRNCVYRTSWTDFFLAFDELCELDDDVINDTVLESVAVCQTFFTMATGLMPGGKTLKLESDSQVMVIPERFMDERSFSAFQSMLLTARTSAVVSLTTDDVAVILMLTAVNFGKEIAVRLKRPSSLRQLEQIDSMIIDYIKKTKPSDPQTYQIYQDLIAISVMVSCQIEKILS